MRRRIVFFLLLAILLAVLALTVPRWAPPLLNFIGANSDLIQGAEALLAIVTALLSALSLLATFFFSRQPRQAPDASPPATETSNVSSQGAIVGGNVTSGGQFSGRDSYNFHAPVIITGQPPVLPPVPADLTPARDAYLAYVLDRHQFLSLKGMGVSDRVPLKLPLLDLYVPLQARLELPEGETWRRNLRLAGRPLNPDEQANLTGHLSEPRPVLDLIQAHDGLVVLGDPGAGKTTFLKYLALQLALGHGPAIGLGNRLPILAPLSGFANALAAGSVRLDDYIANYFHDIGVDLPVAALLQQALDKGQALVLLDGLDEVKETGLRHTVVQQVVDFYTAQRRRGNKFVLSSRIVGYRAVRPTAPGLAECTLVDFDNDEISAFIERWTATLEKQASGDTAVARDDAARERQTLLDAVQRNPSVHDLASNPLLLTILALMQRQGVTLPERRIELYDQYVKTLISSWNRTRGLGRPPTRDLDAVQTLRILAPLALWMHETSPGVGLVKREEVRRRLEAIYRERGDTDPEAAARRFEDDVHEHAGLLLERGPGEYGFMHLTFEEYLAAVALALRGQGDCRPIVDYLAQHVGDAAWREVALLTVGYLGLIQQLYRVAGEVVEGLLATPIGAPGEAVVLAGAAVLDAWPGGVPPGSRDKAVTALISTMQSAVTAPRLRREAGLLLGSLHWQPDDLDTFVEAPAGEFLYGDPPQKRRIEQRFWIARYPVTNAQYRRFMEDHGYERPEFWGQDGWAWRTGTYETKEPLKTG
ncbi:NACHT domain-containing protein [Candidatus Amarolinea dominans]|uniref:NACHT domain-containing protein n=1 Tax=Candidatus Amarolinea dominans TaxID=3140696 RepID=UPI001DA15DEB|nr:NACHT domain-containing protein [Anaerolineae bacterium]